MTTPLLQNINSPHDLENLTLQEMRQLSEEIRVFLTDAISKTGGHLASNLGIVELTLALHRVFDFSRDRLVFDVGHQCYVHKLITGRRDGFDKLRKKGGLSGFPNPRESEYDPLVVGHASTSISSALGLATAARMRGEDRKVIAVVGDGAIGGGMCFEAMNNAGHAQEDMLVILNDNEMSISETVGAFSTYLTDIRSRPLTQKIREELHNILRGIPLIGASIDWVQDILLDTVKGMIEAEHIFSAMGFRYFGPIDGHDIEILEQELKNLSQVKGPKILHVVSRKGQGFHAAASDPESYHSAVPFEVRGSGEIVKKGSGGPNYNNLFVDQLMKNAEKDERIVAITAAMPSGTGIKKFAEKFPARFIDVGICEAHSITFAAALAKGGMKPVVAIYSTFLQRGYDQIIHDVAVQPWTDESGEEHVGLPVIFALDRAGLVGSDGPTHHGAFDVSYLRHIPNLLVMAPRDGVELAMMLDFALEHKGPVAIRYPRGCPPQAGILPDTYAPLEFGKGEVLRKGKDGTVFAYGRLVEPAFKAAQKAAENGVDLSVVNTRFAKTLDEEMLRKSVKRGKKIFTVEDNALAGGFGSAVLEACSSLGLRPNIKRIGIPDHFIEHASTVILDSELGFDEEGLAEVFVSAHG